MQRHQQQSRGRQQQPQPQQPKLPLYLQGETEEFVAMADLLIRVPVDPSGSNGSVSVSTSTSASNATGGGTSRQPLPPPQQVVTLQAHSQVLARAASAVAGLLSSFAGENGTASSPAQPMDISAFFQGATLQEVLLFLSCAYSPEKAAARLQGALVLCGSDVDNPGIAAGNGGGCGPDGGFCGIVGMLRLAHRLDASRLLSSALEWVEDQRHTLYWRNANVWLELAAELQLEKLRDRVLAWLTARLSEGPTLAAAILKRLDLSSLPSDTCAKLLDGLASAAQPGGHLPQPADFEEWGGLGSMCAAASYRHVVESQAAAAAAVELQFAADLEAQHEQAEADWAAGFEEEEAEGWDDEDDEFEPPAPLLAVAAAQQQQAAAGEGVGGGGAAAGGAAAGEAELEEQEDGVVAPAWAQEFNGGQEEEEGVGNAAAEQWAEEFNGGQQ